ncbi:hypothetical protein [Herbidospora mongoliensis]|uniref:hypothetical protein n=1 Tax=Herbidospora mongoliensis TaxID=688067 RepID=UPI0008374B93|nr:hypothetical protein [Herbidospora mongoliensis]
MTFCQAFADESVRKSFIFCVVLVFPEDFAPIRGEFRSLCKPGQQRVHMTSESDSRRREILSVVARLPVRARLFEARLGGGRSQRVVRDDCLRVAVADLANEPVKALVIESCDQDQRDRQVITEIARKVALPEDFRYRHDRPAVEPLLWLPDVVAWAHGKGGDWGRRVVRTIDTVVKIDP